MNKLNPQQQAAVDYISGPLLVLAGAGSGKTSVITRKIAYLIRQCGIDARHIAALTFTNKAAREMKERVVTLLADYPARGLTISTFHTLGLTIIRHEIKTLGFKPGFSIFDAQDALALIRDIMLQHDDLDSDMAAQIQGIISQLKNDLQSPEQALRQAASGREAMVAQIYQRYEQSLRAYNAVDFDDLILLPTRLFREHAAILEKWQNRLRYLLIDEYQDTNLCQYELIKLLVGTRGALTVVGDDDQSIYAWRGARPENLFQLQQDYPHLKVIKLEQNYRSTQRILRAANTLIANNPHIIDKQLWSQMAHGEHIRIIASPNEDAEAERIVTEIMAHHLQRRSQYRDYAILYRGNHQARLLEMKLQHYQLPYQISGGLSFFARNEIKDIMAYLRLLINPDDDNAFLRIINVPRRQIGSSTLMNLGSFATARGISLYEACSDPELEAHLPAGKLSQLSHFTDWLDRLSRHCDSDDPMPYISELIEDIDYQRWLEQNSSSTAVAEKRMANVWFLISSLEQTLQQQQEEEEQCSIRDAIARLVLRDMLERQEEDEDGNRIQLLTLHAAKGLEYPHVYIVGMEEDILPHRNSIEADTIEEERRLAYVGVTRAQQTLTLSLARKRKQFGEVIDSLPSRFLDELPADDVERFGFGERDEMANQQRGQATLAGLKSLFD